MKPRSYQRITTIVAGAFVGASLAFAILPPSKLLLWNVSASAPIGLYRVHGLRSPVVGDLVAVQPPADVARMMAERHYLPLGVPMLKHVAALEGARVCRDHMRVTVDGRLAAIARLSDRRGHPLPVWRGCHVIGAREMFLLNPAADSMDGRYFGPMPATGLLGPATPILTRDAPDAPLQWRGAVAAPVPSPTKKG